LADRLRDPETTAAETTVSAVADPSPTPIVVSTPSTTEVIQEDLRVDLTSLVYNGEISADQIVPVVAEVAGQVAEVNVEVGDSVQAGDQLVRIDSTILEAQVAQALAGVEAAQSQLDLATTEPKETDLEAARSAVAAARAAYNRALEGATEEDERLALSQLRQAEAAVNLAQAQYDRIASNPFSGMMPESLQLEQATLGLEAAQAGYDKVVKGATADIIAGAYAQLTAAEAQLARLERGADPAQIRAAEAQVNQAELGLYLAQLQLDKATIEAPSDGFIYQLDAVEGGMTGPGTPVAVLFSHDVKILIQVEEFRYQDVQVGQAVAIRVDAYPDRSFAGVVSDIAPTFDHASRTVEVTVIPTGDGAGDLASGMFATVEFGEQQP
jgi:multidrug resistance efflux pump